MMLNVDGRDRKGHQLSALLLMITQGVYERALQLGKIL
jgi:hypothetical protein